jgi:hypothetical protein
VERATGIGGVFVRSPHPEALRAWYAEHLGLELDDFGGAVLRSSGGESLVWAVFADDTDYFGSREQQAMVNYRVSDLDAMLAQTTTSRRWSSAASAGRPIPTATASSFGSPHPVSEAAPARFRAAAAAHTRRARRSRVE